MPQLDLGMNFTESLAKLMWFILIHLLSLPKSNHLKANSKTVLFKDREINFFFQSISCNRIPIIVFESGTFLLPCWNLVCHDKYKALIIISAENASFRSKPCILLIARVHFDLSKVKGKNQTDRVYYHWEISSYLNVCPVASWYS